MQEVFEKIIEKLEEENSRLKRLRNNCIALSDSEVSAIENKAYNFSIEIVKQEAEKYNNGWIPCNERLPEDKQTCLVTARIYFTPDHVDEIDNYIGVEIDTYSKQFGWLGTEPIAWQPLPAQYQPKGEIDG